MPFSFLQPGFPVHLPEPLTLADRCTGGNDFNVLDPANNLEMHLATPNCKPSADEGVRATQT